MREVGERRWGFVLMGAVVAMSVVVVAGEVRAQEDRVEVVAPESAGDVDVMEPGILPTTAALVPGLVVHGLGHMIGGDMETGMRLLSVEAMGLGLIVAGGGPLVATGASRRIITPTISMVLVGFGLFVQSWTADIYGSSVGGTPMVARVELPQVEAELGYRYIYDPQFAYRNFTTVEADFRLGKWRATPLAWVAVDDDNQRLRVDLAYRLVGPQQGLLASEGGDFFEMNTALTWHGYGPEGFSVATGEVSALGRLDLGRMGLSLKGSFAELGLGLGLEGYTYNIEGLSALEDTATLLLMRFSYGMYLGKGGEAVLFYDHRHDDFAAGLGVTGLGGGAAGHLGLEGFYPVAPEWAVTWDFQVGSAYIAGLGVRYLWEGAR